MNIMHHFTAEGIQRFKYLTRCMCAYYRDHNWRCPGCQSTSRTVLRRKHVFTLLARCNDCELMHRLPTDDSTFLDRFYQSTYDAGFTTDCPDDRTLTQLLANRFRESDKDFSGRIEVLKSLGVPQGARVLDFGASWGYGTWQLRAAGFDCEGYELSVPRGTFGCSKLGVTIHSRREDLRQDYDVFFSAHVLEHLPSPAIAIDLARQVLRPGGLFVAFTPNGCRQYEQADQYAYHRIWGGLHPSLLDDVYYRKQFGGSPLLLSGSPYDLASLARWNRHDSTTHRLDGTELLAVAQPHVAETNRRAA